LVLSVQLLPFDFCLLPFDFPMITALAGGVGASKFLEGLSRAAPPEDITVIVNTGDDIELFGLYIAPDLDIVTYTLAGVVNAATGWGLAGDTFHCLDELVRLSDGERWFNLGDRDLATHIYRTELMRRGRPLSEVTERVRRALGVKSRILPMTDTHTPTTILTDEGPLHFQEYLVKRRAQPKVEGIRFENIEAAHPAPGVATATLEAEAVIICPSNPLISIGPILAVPGSRDLLKETEATVAAISPVVGGASLKGPTDRMLADLGMEVSATQVARLYADILDVYIIDHKDEAAKAEIEKLGLKVFVTQTVMSGPEEKLALARATLKAVMSDE
jgi:LPPG:FO 2-phospho-L-lactate transferase